VKIAAPPSATSTPAPTARPAAPSAAPRWDPFAPIVLNPPPNEAPEDWIAAYHRGERRRLGAEADVALYIENPRACHKLPADVPVVYAITLIHRDREEGGPVTEYGITARPPCVFTGTPLHFDPPTASCSTVTDQVLATVWTALRSAELSEMKFTPPDLPNPGFAISVTWPDGHCFVDARGKLDPAFESAFQAAKRAIAEAFDAGKRR
jgi:hypothetical protein